MLATKFDVRGKTGDWTAKDVERDDSFNKKSGHATVSQYTIIDDII